MAPDKIPKQLEYNDGDIDSDILPSSQFGTFYHSIKRARFVQTSLWQDVCPIDYFLYKFNEMIWMSQSVWLVRRKLTENAGLWNEKLTKDQDGEYFCRTVSVSKGIKFIPDAICFYRNGNITVSTNISEKAMESAFLSRCLCIQYLLALKDTERIRSACVKYLQFLLNVVNVKREHTTINVLINKLHNKAEELGANLQTPTFKWKYETIKAFFGSSIADKMKYIFW